MAFDQVGIKRHLKVTKLDIVNSAAMNIGVQTLSKEWINNKVLLYTIGNYIQYPVINHNGKEYFKKSKTESLRCTVVIHTTL